jgi:hypothetical protein
VTSRLAFVIGALRSQLDRVPLLPTVGVIGVALGAFLLLASTVRGPLVAPEGNLIETATFDGSLGLFILTMALLAPQVEWKNLRRWARYLSGLTLFAYTVETVQAVRGIDPRFNIVSDPLDRIAGLLFFLSTLAIMGLFIGLALKFFRAPASALTLAVRYGTAASLIAFGVGIWMSLVSQGRVVAPDGNLLTLHGAGFHGVQFVPLIALLLYWAGVPEHTAQTSIHAAGAAWLTVCLAVAWQSSRGTQLLEPTVAAAAAAGGLLLFTVVALQAHAFGSTVVTPHHDSH